MGIKRRHLELQSIISSKLSTMYTLKAFLVVVVASSAYSAPPSDIPAECLPKLDKVDELTECCKMTGIYMKQIDAAVECFKLVKDKPTPGEKKPPVIPIPEGFACMEECVLSKMGYLGADKKLLTEKVASDAKTSYTGDWATVGPTFTQKCITEAATASVCSGEPFNKCIFRETYLNCPEKSWTNSDACKANKERVQKCPKALPFLPKNIM